MGTTSNWRENTVVRCTEYADDPNYAKDPSADRLDYLQRKVSYLRYGQRHGHKRGSWYCVLSDETPALFLNGNAGSFDDAEYVSILLDRAETPEALLAILKDNNRLATMNYKLV
jgi:hypothetical protein